jgi:hypothetical protein
MDAKNGPPSLQEREQKDYEGHRQRLKKRFAETGFQGFQDYEALEFLLYFALPRRDTKHIARNLLRRFNNFIGVIHTGEAEALVLARRKKADWFLTDDSTTRLFVSLLGMEVHGSLGVVLWNAAHRHLSRAETERALIFL